MSALSLFKKHTMEELVAMDARVSAAPENQAPSGPVYIHTLKTRKLTGEIAQAITWHLEERRAARGQPVPVSGYSGRQTNRR